MEGGVVILLSPFGCRISETTPSPLLLKTAGAQDVSVDKPKPI